MKPVKFKEYNATFNGKGFRDLPVLVLENHLQSKWKLSFFERVKVLFAGVIWFSLRGQSHPPISLSVNKMFVVEKTAEK